MRSPLASVRSVCKGGEGGRVAGPDAASGARGHINFGVVAGEDAPRREVPPAPPAELAEAAVKRTLYQVLAAIDLHVRASPIRQPCGPCLSPAARGAGRGWAEELRRRVPLRAEGNRARRPQETSMKMVRKLVEEKLGFAPDKALVKELVRATSPLPGSPPWTVPLWQWWLSPAGEEGLVGEARLPSASWEGGADGCHLYGKCVQGCWALC